MEYSMKQNPGPGMCPVSGCRKRLRNNGRLCSMHDQRRWRAQNPEKAAYLTLRSNAKRRGKEFRLTLEEFLDFISKNTYLDDKGVTRHSLHLDRIDDTLGYVPGNLQTLSCSENVIKENDRRKYVKYFQEHGDPAIDDDNTPF